MKIQNILFSSFCILVISSGVYPQDIKTVNTKVDNLLAQFPANTTIYTNILMEEMYNLGEDGIKQICSQVVPVGSVDDTKARFAIESFSRFLSQPGKESQRKMWEKVCIDYSTKQTDAGVKDFFMKQLQLIGDEDCVEPLKGFLQDKELCGPALAALVSAGGKSAETVLAESLKNKELSCAAAVMNALASMKSQMAVNEYIEWSKDINVNTKASAYNALAQSGSPLAFPVLSQAAKSAFYRWDHTGATTALLNYAKVVGENGDLKTMDKICKLVMKKCNDKTTIQNKSAALIIFTGFHGIDATPYLLKAAGHSDKSYRNTALQASLGIPGNEMTSVWIKYFPKAISAAKPEIISVLGERKDPTAVNLITASLSHPDKAVRAAAALSLARIEGKKAVPSLISYLTRFSDPDDQVAAKKTLMTVSGDQEISLLKPVLKEGSLAARKTAIELIAWNQSNEYFDDILSFTSSQDEDVRTAAYKALADLAQPADQGKLLDLIAVNNDVRYIPDIQEALASAATKIPDAEKRSEMILKTMEGKPWRENVIPVLAKTGGKNALTTVLKEFENGDAKIRDLCFRTLTSWSDYKASSALYEICASGNKTFEEPAFNAYVEQIKDSDLPDDEKLLLFRKIIPFALSSERKNKILTELGGVKTYLSLFFVSNYLDDPTTSATAAKAAMYIALPAVNDKPGMYGTIVREILSKAAPRLTGPESEYDREMINKYLSAMPADEGFKPMFNGKDLTGWQGLVEDPVARSKMSKVDLERKQAEADVLIPSSWSVKDGCIWFNGKGSNLCSITEYGDFEMLVDWKISRWGDSGIYLRGSPQVQIWDTSRTDAGAQVGSGGLYNNQINQSKPIKVADNPIGDWNTFRIIMVGEKVSVWLNGEKVVDDVVMENYWNRKMPIFPKGPIELQAHGTDLGFRDIYVREIK